MASNLAFATKHYAHDRARLSLLLGRMADEFVFFPFDPERKPSSAARLLGAIVRNRPALVVMEGTSVAGGIPLLLARALLGTQYVVVGGDAVGPFVARHRPMLGPAAWLYEGLLMRFCAGFIGWTPYLVGRALTFGAPRGTTAPGWSSDVPPPSVGTRVRERLGIAEHDIVFGLVGSLNWVDRVGYTYGAELVRAVKRTSRSDVVVVIVGDGSGLPHLERLAGDELGRRVRLVGRVPRDEVFDYLHAFSIASLPGSCDQIGEFRYTTKLPEYLAAGLPIVTGQLPVAYDLVLSSSWILPGSGPWSEEYIVALSELMATVTWVEIAQRRPKSDAELAGVFSLQEQQARVGCFITDLNARS